MNVVRTIALMGAVTVAVATNGEDMPFWGDVPSATNRAAAASVEIVLRPAFESRLYADCWLPLMEFSSLPVGFLLLFR